jgi:hypothetical protein
MLPSPENLSIRGRRIFVKYYSTLNDKSFARMSATPLQSCNELINVRCFPDSENAIADSLE